MFVVGWRGVSVVVSSVGVVKRVVRVKLLPEGSQAHLLQQTLRACNDAANEVSRVARERGIASQRDLRSVTYGTTKVLVPGAQAAQQVIRKVAGAYAAHRANLRAGNYGRRGSERRARAEARVIGFRPDAAQPYDDRILSWRINPDHQGRGTVSIWVADTGAGAPGRILVPFVGRPEHVDAILRHRKGETDLVCRDGVFYLIPTLDHPTPEAVLPSQTSERDWIGVDLGIVNIAYTSDGTNWSGGAVTHVRKKNQYIRTTAQTRGTRSAKRLLKKRRRKEARFVTDVNHRVSKKIVAEAQRTGRGIALEDLTGIRARARHRKPQRATFHSWAFAQLGAFITYKAQAAGVPVVHVNPAYTSQTCWHCKHVDDKARNGEDYTCTNPDCGLVGHADHNGARNIAHLAPAQWARKRQADSHAANDAA